VNFEGLQILDLFTNNWVKYVIYWADILLVLLQHSALVSFI